MADEQEYGGNFTIKVELDGQPVTMDVQPIDEFFRVTRNGEHVADAQLNEMWYQMDVPMVDEDLFDKITTAISQHYD